MRRFGLLSILVVLLATAAPGAPVTGKRTYDLRVTSSVAGREIEFEGAYLFTGSDATLHSVRRATPFTVHADGEAAMGFFRTIKGDAQLVVELTTSEGGKPLHSTRTRDDGVMFAINLVDDMPYFTHSFTWPRQ